MLWPDPATAPAKTNGKVTSEQASLMVKMAKKNGCSISDAILGRADGELILRVQNFVPFSRPIE